MEMAFTAVFRKAPEGYIAFVEELPGANTQGATLEEAWAPGLRSRHHAPWRPAGERRSVRQQEVALRDRGRFSRQVLVQFAVARYGRGFSSTPVHVHGLPTTLTEQQGG
jgi:hypothetical protein